MKNIARPCLIAALALLTAGESFAYEVQLHAAITRKAVDKAVAEDDFFARAGIRSRDSFAQLFNFDSFGEAFRAQDWIVNGSVYEDDFFNFGPTFFVPRSAFHWFDPKDELGLSMGDSPSASRFKSSRDWATDGSLNPVYAIPEARDNFFKALTNTDSLVRPRLWADTFRAVGQFTHLVQDTAQPQHVRDDVHLSFSERLSRQFPAIFPRWSRYEAFTRPLDPADTYPIVKLPTFPSYWKTGDGRGLAEFTNTNFVSEQTNFKSGTRYADPAEPIDPLSFPEVTIPQVVDLDGNTVVATNITVRFVSNVAQDLYDPSQTAVNPKLSAFSVFDFQHFKANAQHVYSLYNDNHQAYFDLLAPRAVGYSAGMIQHFFRGQLVISAPDEVVYAMIDPVQASSFSKIKLKVSNTTPNENMVGGSLWLVAKFHRNKCYRSDLTGEPNGPNASNFLACLTDEEELVVSGPKTVTLNSGAAPFPLSFDLGQTPIPVNATDLTLQVVYRGPLGTSETDVVAVGTKDLFEPTHIAYMNGTDADEINDVFYRFDQVLAGVANGDPKFASVDVDNNQKYQVPPDFFLFPFDLSDVAISFTGNNLNPVATIASLPSGRFARMTVLTDRPRLDFFPGQQHFRPPAAVNQLSDDGSTFFATGVQKLRGVWVTDGDVLDYCVFTTSCNGDLLTMPDSITPNASTPMAVTVNIAFP